MKNYFTITATLFAATLASAGSLQKDLQDRLLSVKVRQVNNKYFLEGAVDRVHERDYAVELCGAYYGDNACKNFIRVRPPSPNDPHPVVKIEYRVLYVPEAPLAAGDLLKSKLYTAEALPAGSKLLSSVALFMADTWAWNRAEPSRSVASDASEIARTQEIQVGSAATKQPLLMNTESQVEAIPGTDSIALRAKLHLKGGKGEFAGQEKIFNSHITLRNGETTALGAWVLDHTSERSPALIIYATATKARKPGE